MGRAEEQFAVAAAGTEGHVFRRGRIIGAAETAHSLSSQGGVITCRGCTWRVGTCMYSRTGNDGPTCIGALGPPNAGGGGQEHFADKY